MPFVHIHWYEGRDAEQKAELARRITDAMVEVGKTTSDQVWIRFDESSKADWAMDGQMQAQ